MMCYIQYIHVVGDRKLELKDTLTVLVWLCLSALSWRRQDNKRRLGPFRILGVSQIICQYIVDIIVSLC